jgi:hypothetical protein
MNDCNKILMGVDHNDSLDSEMITHVFISSVQIVFEEPFMNWWCFVFGTVMVLHFGFV